MAALQTLRALQSKIPLLNRQVVSYLAIQGQINKEMTYQVGHLLRQVPSSARKLAIVVNSMGGDMSQAHLISQKILGKAKQNNIELVTFAQEFALNSAFYVLVHGNRVYADQTTYVGGLEVGESKLIPGPLAEYYRTVVYSQGPTYTGEKAKNEPYLQAKRTQIRELYASFNQEMRKQIQSARRLSSQLELSQVYVALQAKNLGLIDGVARIHQEIHRSAPGSSLSKLKQSKIAKMLASIRSLRALR